MNQNTGYKVNFYIVLMKIKLARTYCARSPHCQPLHLSFGSRQFPPSQGGGEGLL